MRAPSFLTLAVLAAIGVLFAGVQTAGAQGTTPPGAQPVAAADLSVSLSGEGTRLEENDTYKLEALVTNGGPGTARDVKLFLSIPDEYDLDDVSMDAECRTDPGQEGRMVCHLGTMAPSTQVAIKIRGEFHDAGDTTTHAWVEGLVAAPPAQPGAQVGGPGGDPDMSNNQASQHVDVSDDNDRGGGSSGSNPPAGPITTSGGDPDPVECPEGTEPDGENGCCIPKDWDLRHSPRAPDIRAFVREFPFCDNDY